MTVYAAVENCPRGFVAGIIWGDDPAIEKRTQV
jgi:hypothetical protein